MLALGAAGCFLGAAAQTVAVPISEQHARAGEAFEFVIPEHTFSAPAGEALNLTGSVLLAAGGIRGGAVGLAFVPGEVGEARVEGTSTLIGGGMATVVVTATLVSNSSAWAVHEFNVSITGAHFAWRTHARTHAPRPAPDMRTLATGR